MFKVKNIDTRTMKAFGVIIVSFEHISHPCSIVSIINFEHVNADWVEISSSGLQAHISNIQIAIIS